MGPLTLDASVLIALLDTADVHHDRSVNEVDAAGRRGLALIVPASAYSETLVAFARTGRVRDAAEAIASMGITVATLDGETVGHAAQLRARYDGLRLPDALVLATARQLSSPLLTHDQRLQRYAVEETDETTTTSDDKPPRR